MTATTEVLAIRYGTRTGSRADSFHRYKIYDEPDAPLVMDYFFWVVLRSDEVTLVDCGFSTTAGQRRGRILVIEPVDALRALGIAPESVSRIIVSHFHYDHIGNLASFPNATLTFQQSEFDFWTGPFADRVPFRQGSETGEIDYIRRAMQQGHACPVDGNIEIAPGISVELVGGHCPGQQLVLVEQDDGWIVLASDALHFYEEMERDMPFAGFTDLVATYQTYETLRELERQGAVIVAGHDPLVMNRFPGVNGRHDELAVRLARPASPRTTSCPSAVR